MIVNYSKQNTTLRIDSSSFPGKPFLTWEMLPANGAEGLFFQMHRPHLLLVGGRATAEAVGGKSSAPPWGVLCQTGRCPCLPHSQKVESPQAPAKAPTQASSAYSASLPGSPISLLSRGSA